MLHFVQHDTGVRMVYRGIPDFAVNPDSPDTWRWRELKPGGRVTVVKLAPDGAEAARYPAEVVQAQDPEPWLVVRAVWTYRMMELDGLVFQPGDELLEWFSPRHWFNAFAVLSPEGHFRGWYANVTYPARLDTTLSPPVLFWHDLYVDLVGLADGTFTMRDDDELAESGLATSAPEVWQRIAAARAEIIERFARGVPPFTISALEPAQSRDGGVEKPAQS